MSSLPLALFAEWLAYGETGLSSKAIMRKLTGGIPTRWGWDYPHDPSDFRRCMLLLEAVPLARLSLDQMRECGPVWDRLVDRWDELEATLKREQERADGMAPETYAMIRRLIDEAWEERRASL